MILVIAEQRDGVLNRASWEPIAAAQQAGDSVKVLVLGSAAHAGAAAKELSAAKVDESLAQVPHPFRPDPVAEQRQ